MSKISLVPITGAQNLTAINSNFQKIAIELNNKVLYRDNPLGEPNQVVGPVDFNSQPIYNLPEPVLDHEPARHVDVKAVPLLAAQAAVSAQQAEASATSAASDAATATIQASVASTAASEALVSEGLAQGFASSASVSAVNAAASEAIASDASVASIAARDVSLAQATIATTKAAEASVSADSALAQANIATTQANVATTQATIATTQAEIATAQATIATDAANSIDEAFLLNRANHTGTQAQSTVVGLTADITALQARQLPLGQGQTYKTISPTLGTWYTNSTGRTIRVGMRGTVSAGVGGIEILVNQPTPLLVGFEMDSLDRIVATDAIIPSAATYQFSATDVGSVVFWELS